MDAIYIPIFLLALLLSSISIARIVYLKKLKLKISKHTRRHCLPKPFMVMYPRHIFRDSTSKARKIAPTRRRRFYVPIGRRRRFVQYLQMVAPPPKSGAHRWRTCSLHPRLTGWPVFKGSAAVAWGQSSWGGWTVLWICRCPRWGRAKGRRVRRQRTCYIAVFAKKGSTGLLYWRDTSGRTRVNICWLIWGKLFVSTHHYLATTVYLRYAWDCSNYFFKWWIL